MMRAHVDNCLLTAVRFAVVVALLFPQIAQSLPKGKYHLQITERPILARLESAGLGLGTQLGDGTIGSGRIACSELARAPLYSSLANRIEKDLREFEPGMKPAPPAMGPGYLFPASWLRSPDTSFELAGIINRLDRKPFVPKSCGETRFIYRLAYRRILRGRPVFSRLPMTINLVFEIPAGASDPTCRGTAEKWVGPEDADAKQAWLASSVGPLWDAFHDRKTLARIEVNLQSERWEPGYRPDLAGHSGYLLRIFRFSHQHRALSVEALENTPDVRKISRESRLRAALRRWIRKPETLRSLDQGTIHLPERYLATRAVSVTPLGLERRANRPFLQIFSKSDFAGLDLTGYRTIRSPAALLRRLDGLSCVGCHQSRSDAGFHFLGEDASDDQGVNAVFSPGSPHFIDEIDRRERYGNAVLAGKVPDDFRPPAERAHRGKGRYGEHCGLGDPGFEPWQCAESLKCLPYLMSETDREVGQCLPETASLGDPCEVGDLTQSADPHQDRLVNVRKLGCTGTALCFPRSIGFPGGMCANECGRSSGPKGEKEICQPVPALENFTGCLRSGLTFRECFKIASRPTALLKCDAQSPCRDDYLCASSQSGAGACVPPYFLFQLVITGHPPLR